MLKHSNELQNRVDTMEVAILLLVNQMRSLDMPEKLLDRIEQMLMYRSPEGRSRKIEADKK